MQDLVSIESVHASIVQIRGKAVILDSELAAYFGLETRALNQAVKRNDDRFEGYAFQLTESEAEGLKSQSVMSNEGRGGRRTAPWVFTEHGVVMAATVLNSARAVKASRRIVDAFVAMKRSTALVIASAPATKSSTALTTLRSEFLPKLRAQFDALMQTEINPKQRKTLREETEEFIADGLNNLKARLKKSGHENEEIEARVLKHLAEAEEARARAATQHQMTEKQRLKNQANQLRFMIRAEIAMTSGEVSDLLEVLDELGRD
jgi:ORF6N domain